MADKAAGKNKQQQQQPKEQPQQQQNHHHQQKQQQQQQQQQQQKKKKDKQPKKGNHGNNQSGQNFVKREWLISPEYADFQEKKFLKRKKKLNTNHYNTNNSNSNNINKSSRKKLESNKGSFLWVLFIHLSYILLFLGFIYIVDYDNFLKIKGGASYCFNKTVSLLSPEVLSKGKLAVEFIQPVADVTVNKATVFVKEVSSFLNTNPLVKDHWTNIREISSICSARLVDYMRTVYLQITGYCNDVKTKFF